MLKVVLCDAILKRTFDFLKPASSSLYHGRLKEFLPPHTGTAGCLGVRHNFLGRITEEDLWRGVTSVSNAGRKGGRQRTMAGKKVQLLRGQKIGEGFSASKYPGLNQPIFSTGTTINRMKIKGKEKVEQSQEKEEERETELDPFIRKRIEFQKKRKLPLNRHAGIPPMQRGYKGTSIEGRSLGPVNENMETDFEMEGFDSKIIECRRVGNIIKLGKTYGVRVLVVVGNGNGIAGFGIANGKNRAEVMEKAKRQAFQRLQFFERCGGRTVFHDFYVQEHKTKLTVQRRRKGFGVVANMVVKDLCRLIGIKDVYIKVEGARKNRISITRGLFEGLQDQETYQQLADRTKMHVVEYRMDRGNFPVVIASPSDDEVRKELTNDEKEWLDIDSMYSGGKIQLRRRRRAPFWERMNLKSWQKKRDEIELNRGQYRARLERIMCNLEPSPEEFQARFRQKKEKN